MAEEKEKRLNRFTKEEDELIKNTFRDNEELLKSLRKFFYQLPLNAVDLSNLEINRKNKPLLKVLRRRLLPEIEADLPFSALTKQVDQFTVIPINQLMPESAVSHIKAMEMFRAYMNQQLEILESGKFTSTPEKCSGHLVEPKLKFKELSILTEDNDNSTSSVKMLKPDLVIYLNIFARNQVLEQVEQQLLLLDLKANERELTQDEMDDMKRKNSSK